MNADEYMKYVEDLELHSFTKEELKAIYDILEREWIPYENELAHKVVNKMWKIINEKLD